MNIDRAGAFALRAGALVNCHHVLRYEVGGDFVGHREIKAILMASLVAEAVAAIGNAAKKDCGPAGAALSHAKYSLLPREELKSIEGAPQLVKFLA